MFYWKIICDVLVKNVMQTMQYFAFKMFSVYRKRPLRSVVIEENLSEPFWLILKIGERSSETGGKGT